MPKTGKTNGNKSATAAGPPCAYCTNSTPADEAVKCSSCQEIAHRYCAGVPMKEFRSISESNPHHCAKCLKETYLSTISEMKSTIAALQGELRELRETMNELCTNQQQSSNAPGAHNPVVESVSFQGSQQWSEVVKRNGRARRPAAQRQGAPPRADRSAPGSPNRTSSSQNLRTRRTDNRGIQHARTKIPGARKVWGTHKSTTTGEVKGAISVLANIAPADLAVKRKFRVQESNVQRSTWWFVLRADENTLRRLEDSWNTLALPRRWRLKPLFTFMDDGTETSTSQETHPPSHSDDSNGHSSEWLGGCVS